MWVTSKFIRPTVPTEAIHRPRLYSLLNRWPQYRLILVRAAAGYGKSSLVGMWADQKDQASIAWLSLDRSDADPIQFIRYVAAALEPIAPGVFDAVSPILNDLQPNPLTAMSALLAALSVEPSAEAGPILLVLDDYHRVQADEINDLMTVMLDRAPARLHLMILTRDLPKLPLARLMVTGSMLELTIDDLRFDPEEVAQFLHTIQLPPRSREQMTQIIARSEGWVAGLKMAGLSPSSRSNPELFLEHLHGATQWQAAYLAGEVLAQQSPQMRQFLLRTSILERLSGRLCTAVTEMPEAPALLKAAFTTGLFLIPLDSRQMWYRYHHLFQEMLQRQLAESHSEADIRRLHHLAGAWSAAEGDSETAIDHFLAAGDNAAAVAQLEHLVRQAIYVGELHRADVLLRRLPAEIIQTAPSLLILDSMLRLLRIEVEAFIPGTAQAARALAQVPADAPDRPRMEAELAICRAGSSFLQRKMPEMGAAIADAVRSEHLLHDKFRGVLQFMQFHHAMQHGDWAGAEAFARQVTAIYQGINDTPGLIGIQREIGVLLLYTGRGAAAARELDESIAAHSGSQPNIVLRTLQYNLNQAAEVYYWMNDMERMRQRARAAADIGKRLGGDASVTLAAQFIDLYNLANPTAPETNYMQARSLTRAPNGLFLFSIEYEIIYQIRSRRIDNGILLANSLGISAESDPATLPPSRLVVYALAQVAAGDDLCRLDALMTQGLDKLQTFGYRFFLGRLQAIEAWRQLRLSDAAAAKTVLAAAVETATRTGFVRAILDIPDLRPILAEVDHPRAAFLAAMMNPDEQANRLAGQSLTSAELRVLELLARDQQYDEIADQLAVSIHTIQSHIKNIYRKLGVSRRMAAIETARLSGLIE